MLQIKTETPTVVLLQRSGKSPVSKLFTRWHECSVLFPQSVETQSPKYWIEASLWQCHWATFEESAQGPPNWIYFPSFPDVHKLKWLQKSLDNHLSQRCLLCLMLGKQSPATGPPCSSKSQPEYASWCLALFVPFAPLPTVLSGGKYLKVHDGAFLAGNNFSESLLWLSL